MRRLSIACVAGLALAATAASAQTPAAPPAPVPAPGGADTAATGPYAGAGNPHGFYDVQARIDQMQQAAGALPPAKGHRVTAQLKTIRSDLKFRMGRHNGELRDFDREVISDKLDHLAAQYPALQN
jgi:hypothetical protein